MFRLTPDPTFACQVQITVPGQTEQAKLDLVFRHKGRKALREWIDGAKDRRDGPFLAEVIESWSGVENAKGEPVDFSADSLDELLDEYQASGEEIFSAYLRALTEARGKN